MRVVIEKRIPWRVPVCPCLSSAMQYHGHKVSLYCILELAMAFRCFNRLASLFVQGNALVLMVLITDPRRPSLQLCLLGHGSSPPGVYKYELEVAESHITLLHTLSPLTHSSLSGESRRTMRLKPPASPSTAGEQNRYHLFRPCLNGA